MRPAMARRMPGQLILCAILGSGLGGCANLDRETELIHRHLALEPSATVADIGAGAGDYAFGLARRLGPDGRVIATELDPERLRALRRRAARSGLDNVSVVAAAGDATGLPAGCCAGAFMRGVYHHLTEPGPVLADLYRALKPGGRLLVIDFRPSPWLAPWTPEGLPADRSGHGIDPQTITTEAAAAGFVAEQQIEDWPTGLLTDLYGLVLRKPEVAAP